MTIEQKLVLWFEQQSGQSEIDPKANYFEIGLIDSFDVIMLIDFCEAEFGVVFSEKQFEDRRFASILGLIEIINELKG